MNGKNLRIEKLFNNSKNAVIVAFDHGLFDGPIAGMEDLTQTAKKISPSVDGVLLSPGMLRHTRHCFNYKGAPIPITRINWSTIYCFHWGYNKAKTVIAQEIEDAVGNGAEIVLVSLTIGTGDEDTDTRNVEVYSYLVNQAERLGIPVIGEFFPVNFGKLSPEKFQEQVYSSVRILCELGCDMIKTFHTHDFKKVTQSVPVPVFGLGAEKTPTQLQALQLAAKEIEDGARGVVFGRNAIQVPDPIKFQKALCDVVKRNTNPVSAIARYGIKD
ncbi:MAG: hypothetical protein NW207_02120 [Cytophagales bacterium]|nr:hypothetical protein [Cytophagales bacterium]